MNNRELFLRHVGQTSPAPLAVEITKAQGVFLFGPNGEKYIDVISGVSVSNVGHCHPEVVKAIKEQAEQYMHLMVYGEIVQTPQVQYAKRLADLLPTSLNSVFFVNSGSEAIEGAIKLARRYTGKTELISCYNAYHGCTNGAMSVMGCDSFTKNFQPLLPDCKRIHHGKIEDLEQITKKTAAVIIEIVPGEGGIFTAENSYWQQLKHRCEETKTLLIFDEVQTGFGRTGSLFAFEQIGIIPDILVIAKAMGGGMPIGAFVADKAMMDVFTNNPTLGHITTFGGHPVCCAAGLASLNIIEREKLYEKAKDKAALFYQRLIQLPHVKEIRYCGLMMAVEFGDTAFNFSVNAKCLEKGLLTDWFLFRDTALRIAPPLIISEEEINAACDILEAVLKAE